MSPLFKDMGVGLGLRPAHHSLFLEKTPASVSWVEVISENYMPWTGRDFGRSLQTLLKVRQDLPVALHGVSLNIGSSDDLDVDYLKRLKRLIDAVDPAIVSDHLSWTGVRGENLHDLLPLPYTAETLELVTAKIARVQDILGRQLLIENPSTYLEFTTSTLSEPEFINEVLKRTDCGLLLDVNNVYVSSINHGFDAKTYIEKLPADHIGQIHLAGHSQNDGFLIDTHDAPVCDDVWQLYRWTTELIGKKSTMIERDGNIPEWNELEQEILKIHEVRSEIAR